MRHYLYLLLFVLFIVLNSQWWTSFQMINDEAVTVHGAQRWLVGEWPYWHWITRQTPGCYALTALFFAFFGDSQPATRALMLILASLQGLVIFHLSRPLSGWRRFAPWLLWCWLGLIDFPILGYHWMSVLNFTVVVAFCQSWVARQPRAAAGLGLALASGVFFLQSEGLAGLVLTGFCWLRWRPPGLGRLAAWLVGSSLLLWMPFLPVLPVIVKASVLDMKPHLLFNRHPYAWADLIPMIQGARASSAAGDPLGFCYIHLKVFVYCFKYGLLYVVLALSLWRQRKMRSADEAILAVGVACLVAVNLNRQTLEYGSYLLPIWFILSVRLAGRGTALVLGLCGLFWLLNLAVWWRDCRTPIATPAGVYWTEESWAGRAYGRLGEWAALVTPAQAALCLPFQPCLYTLWHLKNPSPETNLIPISRARSAFEETARLLDQQEVPWIIYTPMTPHDCNADPVEFQKAAEEMLAILTTHYELRDEFGGMKLFQRR